MPKCSSSYTTFGASRHMNSIVSWSPSQSEPFTVSYMCHSQESSPMLPSAAPIPPCAATVCERVGNTLDNTATERPLSASCRAARSPAPPAPTTTASKLRVASAKSDSPEDLHRPAGAGDEPQDRRDLQREPKAGGVDIVHEDVAHPDPGVNQHARHEHEGRGAHPALREDRLPRRVSQRPAPQRQREHQRIGEHRDRGDPLREPVLQPVVRADEDATHHSRPPMSAVSARPASSTATALRRAA